VEKSKKIPVKEYTISDKEYVKREIEYATIEKGEYYISNEDSFLEDIDFNELFSSARAEVDKKVNEKIDALRQSGILSEDEVAATADTLRKRETHKKKGQLDEILMSKRPEALRKKSREFLYNNANEAANALLDEKGIDPKANTLYCKFKKLIFSLTPTTTNDGILVWYINTRLTKRFGPVKNREPEQLLTSQKYLEVIIEEIRRMI